MIQCAKDIAANNNVKDVYEKLIPVFDESGLIVELAGLQEKIFNITKNPNLWLEIGNIFFDKTDNTFVAKDAYNKYLQFSQPEFFNRYAQLFEEIVCSESNENQTDEKLLLVSDRYISIIYIMVCFYTKQMYDEILEVEKYLDIVKKEVIKVGLSLSQDYSIENDTNIMDANIHFSNLLSQLGSNMKLQELAIRLNTKNQAPYFNILNKMVFDNEYKKAIDYYNEKFCPVFEANKTNSIADLCDRISGSYACRDDYFNAVKLQKKAIDIVLGE